MVVSSQHQLKACESLSDFSVGDTTSDGDLSSEGEGWSDFSDDDMDDCSIVPTMPKTVSKKPVESQYLLIIRQTEARIPETLLKRTRLGKPSMFLTKISSMDSSGPFSTILCKDVLGYLLEFLLFENLCALAGASKQFYKACTWHLGKMKTLQTKIVYFPAAAVSVIPRYCPNLVALPRNVLKGLDSMPVAVMTNLLRKCEKIENLECLPYRTLNVALDLLRRQFPNVTSFVCDLSHKEGLSRVWSDLPNLQSVSFMGPLDSDASKTLVQAVSSNPNFKNLRTANFADIAGYVDNSLLAALCSLPKLESLTITRGGFSHFFAAIIEKGVENSLRRLEISRAKFSVPEAVTCRLVQHARNNQFLLVSNENRQVLNPREIRPRGGISMMQPRQVVTTCFTWSQKDFRFAEKGEL